MRGNIPSAIRMSLSLGLKDQAQVGSKKKHVSLLKTKIVGGVQPFGV